MNFVAKILPQAEGSLDVQILKIGINVITDVKTIKISNSKGFSIVFDSLEGSEVLSLQLDDIHKLQYSFSTFLDVVILETKLDTVKSVTNSFQLPENSFDPGSTDERKKFITITLDQLDDSDRRHLTSFLNSLKVSADFELIRVEFSDMRNVQNFSESSSERMAWIRRPDGSVEVFVEKEPSQNLKPVEPVRPVEPINSEVKPVQLVSDKLMMEERSESPDIEVYYNPRYYKDV